MKIRLQPPREEIIKDLKNIVVEQLSIFQKETGAFPEHIFFFRDGVSEGQFQQVCVVFQLGPPVFSFYVVYFTRICNSFS